MKFKSLSNKDNFLTTQENFKENIKISETGATLKKNRSGLPVNLFLDDSGSWSKSGHGKIIKFQADNRDHPNTRNMISMSIDDDPQIVLKEEKVDLTASELEQIKIFVRSNKDLLIQLSDSVIDIVDFIKRMETVRK